VPVVVSKRGVFGENHNDGSSLRSAIENCLFPLILKKIQKRLDKESSRHYIIIDRKTISVEWSSLLRKGKIKRCILVKLKDAY
jgi:hypothetical protein